MCSKFIKMLTMKYNKLIKIIKHNYEEIDRTNDVHM